MRWKTKWRIQQALSLMPAGGRMYYHLQRRFGGLKGFQVDERMAGAEQMLGALRSAGCDVSGARTMEIGTGWVPVVPLVLFLHGVAECDTYDISRLLSDELTLDAARQLAECMSQRDIPTDNGFQSRLTALAGAARADGDWSGLLAECGIRYHAPVDTRSSGIAGESLDLVYSNAVLEHVASSDVDELFAEAHRVLRPGGFTAHLVDLCDHFSYSDPQINAANFLQFSGRDFANKNTRFMHQNRLRAPELRAKIENSGFEIAVWETTVDERALREYGSSRVDQCFECFSPEDNCTTGVTVVARRK